MKRLNITLPDTLTREMENVPNKNRFIADALKEKLEKIKKQKLDKLLIEGYKATHEEDYKINKEWEKITVEDWK